MKKVIFLFQELIKLSLFIILSYIWLSYSLSSKSFALILSIVISVLLEILTLLVSKKKNVKKNIKFSEEKAAEDMFFSLVINKNPLEFFFSLFKSRHKHVTQNEYYIIVENQDNQQTLFYPFMQLKELDVDDMLKILKSVENVEKVVIVCGNYSKNCEEYTKILNQNVVLLNKYDTYLLLYKEYDFFPAIENKPNEAKKHSIKNTMQSIFSKTKAKSYILAGCFLLLSSLYVPFSLYYKVTATLLLSCGVICMLNKGKTTKKELV